MLNCRFTFSYKTFCLFGYICIVNSFSRFTGFMRTTALFAHFLTAFFTAFFYCFLKMIFPHFPEPFLECSLQHFSQHFFIHFLQCSLQHSLHGLFQHFSHSSLWHKSHLSSYSHDSEQFTIFIIFLLPFKL